MDIFTKTFRLLLTILAVSLIGRADGSVIPSNRTTDWTPKTSTGVIGGIPNRTTVFISVVDAGADPTGTRDSTANIQNAVNATPWGQVTWFPRGTYRIEGQICMKNAVTLRGEGTGLTILKPTGGGRFYTNGEWPLVAPTLAVTDGAVAGSKVLTVADTSTVVVQRLITITQTNPSWVHLSAGLYGAGPNDAGHDGSRLMAVTVKSVAKTGTTITLEHPLPIDFPNSPKLTLWNHYLTSDFGFENMTFDMAQSAATSPINFVQIYGCWIKGVEFKNAYSRQLLWSEAVNCEIRDSYAHDSNGTGPNHEGVDLYQNDCYNLIENNIFVKAGKPAVILGDWGGGCAGNVIAYNYFEGVPSATGALQASISVNHGPHNMFNLLEGNIGQSMNSDGYYGSVSHTTMLRNAFSGDYPAAVDWRYSVQLCKWSYYSTFLGNVLGTPGVGQAFNTVAPDYSQTSSVVWQLGYPNTGNSHFADTYSGSPEAPGNNDPTSLRDLAVESSTIRHGNYDFVNRETTWEADDSKGIDHTDHTIPKSLYLSGKPGWWPATLSWPPIGPELDPMIGQIPAQLRLQNGVGNVIPSPPTNLRISSGN